MNNEIEREAFAKWATRENKYHTSGYNPCSDVELAFQAGAEWQRSLAQAELAALKAKVSVQDVDPFPPTSTPEPGWDSGYESGYNDAIAQIKSAPAQPQNTE